MPILARPRQPAHLDAQDDADVIEADLGQESLEAEPALRGLAAVPLVLVDDDHPVRRPAQGDGATSQVVLQGGRLAMLEHLLGGGLPHIDDRQPIEVPGPDLARSPRGARRSPVDIRGRPIGSAAMVHTPVVLSTRRDDRRPKSRLLLARVTKNARPDFKRWSRPKSR